MPQRSHKADRDSCPLLPTADVVIRPHDISDVKKRGGLNAYLAALTCAQSLWLQALPAQALLQLNHAMSHDFGEENLPMPMPYQALAWIMERRHEEDFLGNPVRHFQHLASRMSGPNKDLRVARAWVCFHLAERVLPSEKFPRDQRQIEKEELQIPEVNTLFQELMKLVSTDEIKLIKKLIGEIR